MTDYKPGVSLNLDLVDHQAPGQRTEHEIDGFITSRHKQRVKSEGEPPRNPCGAESVRRHNARVYAENAALRHEYRRDQAARLMADMSSLLIYTRRRPGTTDTGPRKERQRP